MSRQVVFLSFLLLASVISVNFAPADPGAIQERGDAPQGVNKPQVPGEIIIKFKADASNGEKNQIRSELGGMKIKGFGRIKAEHRRLGSLTVDEAIAQYQNQPKVEYIEPNYILEASEIG